MFLSTGEYTEKSVTARTMVHTVVLQFEGVCVNCRHPGPLRWEPKVCSASCGSFRVDWLDPLENSWRLQNEHSTMFLALCVQQWGVINLKENQGFVL